MGREVVIVAYGRSAVCKSRKVLRRYSPNRNIPHRF